MPSLIKPLAILATTVAVALSVGAAAADASTPTTPYVIGGQRISVQQAPWTVFLRIDNPAGACGGSILDPTHVLTAAHCVVPDGQTAPHPAADLHVLAGASDVSAWTPGQTPPSGSQARSVSRVSVHPHFVDRVHADDVAVLTVSQAFDLSGANVKSVGLAGRGDQPGDGATVSVAGYGQQSNGGTPDGKLYAAGLNVQSDDSCRDMLGGESADLFCAGASSATPCHGDSGSPLVMGSPPVQVGVVSNGADPCGSSPTAFVDVAAPEVRAFVDGDASIPIAPRQSSAADLRGINPPVDGSPIACSPGDWSGNPDITYDFASDDAQRQVLQSGGSSTYTPGPSDVGKPIVCIVHARNGGGVSTARTGTTPPIAADTSPPQSQITSLQCKGRACTLQFQAGDPGSNGALTAVQAAVSYQAKTPCPKPRHRSRRKSRKKRVCTTLRTTPLTVAPLGGPGYLATATGLPYTRVQFAVSVADAVGNGQTVPTTVSATIKRPASHHKKRHRRARR